MTRFHLTAEQQRLLRAQLCSTDDIDLYRRTFALLEACQGGSPAKIAGALGVSCSSIYNWMDAFARNPQLNAIVDHRGQGRPSLWTDPLKKLLEEALKQAPEVWGYQSIGWTVPLLQIHLEHHSGKRLSAPTIRRKLHERGYIWKQFSYVSAGKSMLNGKAPDSLACQAVALSSNGYTATAYQQPAVR